MLILSISIFIFLFFKGDTSSSSTGKRQETWMPSIANQSTWDSAIRFPNTFISWRKLETSVAADPNSGFLVAGSRIRIHVFRNQNRKHFAVEIFFS